MRGFRKRRVGDNADKTDQSRSIAPAIVNIGKTAEIPLRPAFLPNADVPIPETKVISSKQSVWAVAYDRLRTSNPDLLATFEAIVQDGRPDTDEKPNERLALAVTRKRSDMLERQWTFKFMNQRVKVREQIQRMMKILELVKDFSSIGSQIDPIHAGLPLAGINVLLTLVLNDSKQNDAALAGIEDVNMIIARSTAIEDVYLQRGDADLQPDFMENLTVLFTKILEYQATAACHFGRNTFVRTIRSTLQLEDWAGLLNDVKAKDSVCTAYMQLFDSKDQRSGMKYLQKTLDQHEADLRNVLDLLHTQQQENISIIQFFSDVQCGLHHDQVRRTLGPRYHGSGKWLLARVDNWLLLPRSSMMWLCGTVGTGKTCATSIVIQHLTPPVAIRTDHRLAYVYVSQKQPGRSDPIDICRALLAQLAWSEGGTKIAAPLKYFYDERGRGQTTGGGQPDLEETIALIVNLTSSTPQTTIIIDAADESSDPWELLASLQEIYAKSVSKVKVFLSSRMNVEVARFFPDCEKIQIDEGKNSEDIEAYIRGEVEHQKRRLLDGKYPDLEKRLMQILLARAQGMFIWVKLQLVTFLSPKTRLRFSRDVEKKLDMMERDLALPETNSLYEQIIEINTRPGSQDREYAIKALQWTLCAMEDLPPNELAQAISIDLNGDFDNEVDAPMLLDICSNLIVLDNDGNCRLAHLSVKGFLLRPEGPVSEGPVSEGPVSEGPVSSTGLFTESQAHSQVAESCLYFLSKPGSAKYDHYEATRYQNTQTGFRSYATYNWAHHSSLAAESSQPLKSLVASFLNPITLSPEYLGWALPLLGDTRGTVPPLPKPYPSHFFRMGGTTSTDRKGGGDSNWRNTLVRGHIVSLMTSPPCPAFVASAYGFLEVLQATPLIELRTRRGRMQESCLHFSSSGDQFEATDYLIRTAQVDPSLRDGRGMTALHNASMFGFDQIAQLLLKHMDHDSVLIRDQDGDMALMKCSYTSKRTIMKTIMRTMKPAELAIQNEPGQTAMHQAVRGTRSSGTVELLVQSMRSEDLALQDNEGETALHFAAEQGEDAFVSMLVSHMETKHVKIQNNAGNTALHLAAFNGEEQCVKLLLALDLSPQELAVQNKRGETALHRAVMRHERGNVKGVLAEEIHRCRADVTRLLLTHMTQEYLGVQDSRGRTALHLAVIGDLAVIVSILLPQMTGEQLSIQDHWGRTVLNLAAQSNNEHIFLLLLQSAVDLESKDCGGQTALMTAVQAYHNRIQVAALIKHGAKLDATDNNGWTALHHALSDGKSMLASILIEAGASVDVATKAGWIPLYFAAESACDPAILQKLLEAGANPNQSQARGQMPLHRAIHGGGPHEVIEILLSGGADPLLLDAYGRSCLDWALNDEAMLELLRPYCEGAQPTDQATTAKILRISILEIARRCLSSSEDVTCVDYNHLGHCLLFIGDGEEAYTAFERSIINMPWRIEPIHSVICDVCNANDRIKGTRFVCMTCADMDLCAQCMNKHNQEPHSKRCQGHQFLRIPRVDWEPLPQGHVNRIGETREEWLRRLADKYGKI